MGLRFRKSFAILPGIRLNLSKSGLSTTLGRPGASVNLRGDKLTTTVGAPGTGISYRCGSSHCGAGTSLLLIVLLGAFLVWLTL
jgi:hypothetical protein